MYRSYKIAVDENFKAQIHANDTKGDLSPIRKTSFTKEYLRAELSRMVNQSFAKEYPRIDVILAQWFSEVKADVFISHSGNDEELAHWLYDTFGIKSFIDSELLECITELQEEIEMRHSREELFLYNDKDRHSSAAHAHMIFVHALRCLIDQTECFIYLDTSKCASDGKSGFSPLIFHELATVNTVRESIPKRPGYLEESFDIHYPLHCQRLMSLCAADLDNWAKKMSDYPDEIHALDALYVAKYVKM